MHTFSEKRRILPNLFFEWGRGKEGGKFGKERGNERGVFFPGGKWTLEFLRFMVIPWFQIIIAFSSL